MKYRVFELSVGGNGPRDKFKLYEPTYRWSADAPFVEDGKFLTAEAAEKYVLAYATRPEHCIIVACI